MIKKLSKGGGFTLIEITIVLAIVGMLAGILAPALAAHIANSKLRRATEDVKILGTAIGDFYMDMGEWPVWANGTAIGASDTKFRVLKGTGNDPNFGASGFPTLDGASADNLADQLMLNAPAYTTSGRNAWKGPYIEQFREDPWGNKYLVNAEWLWPGSGGEMGNKPVFVLSAGPNKLVETAYNQTGPGMIVGGDDIVFRIK